MSKIKVSRDVELSIWELTEFLLEARKHGWAGDAKKLDNPERPGFDEYTPFKQGSWEYRDSYTGTYYAPGQEVVRFNGLPVWSMSYSGGMLPQFHFDEEFAKQTFKALREALIQSNMTYPFRGPDKYHIGSWVYENWTNGDMKQFAGRERIYHITGKEDHLDKKKVFVQDYIGGLIVHKIA